MADKEYHSWIIKKVATLTRLYDLHHSEAFNDATIRLHLEQQRERLEEGATRATENVAFAAQGKYKLELGDKIPGVHQYYYAHTQRGTTNPIHVTPQFIEEAYFSSETGDARKTACNRQVLRHQTRVVGF